MFPTNGTGKFGYPHAKINKRLMKNLTLILLEGNRGESFCDIGLGKIFLATTPRAWYIK